MTWLIFALVSCLATCGAMEITRKSKLNGYEVLLYRCTISGFLLLPFVMYMSWPSDFRFYVMAGLNAVIYAWGNIVLANLAVRKNGRVAMMLQPLMIFTTFLVWLAIDPRQVTTLTNDPQQLGMTVGCFVFLLLSLHFIRRNDYAWKSLLTVAPIAIGFALLNIAQKWFMDTPHGGLGLILAIIMIGNFGMVAVLPFLSRYRVRSDELQITHLPVFPIVTLSAIAILHMGGWATMLHAMQIAANPAYPVAIMALTPVVFQIYYWVRGWRDNASPFAGATMAIAALTLGLIHA